MSKVEKYITCIYCGKRTSAKTMKKKFCCDSHKGMYSRESRVFYILNKDILNKMYYKDFKETGGLEQLESRVKKDFENFKTLADKVITYDNKYSVLFFTKSNWNSIDDLVDYLSYRASIM